MLAINPNGVPLFQMQIHNDAQQMRDELDQQSAVRVSVALLGQPGAGKSSLINKIGMRRPKGSFQQYRNKL